MALTDIVIRQAKAGEKPRKMADGKGLYLLLTPAGGKLWRFDYRHLGKRGTLALGQWPETPLTEARAKRDDVRKALEAGIDPGLEKQREKAPEKLAAGDTFAAVAAEYIDKKKREGAASATVAKLEYLAAQLTPAIGVIPVAKLTPADILVPLRKVERKGNLHSAGRCLQFTGQVLRYAVATARIVSDPSRDLRGALEARRVKHRAAITDPVKVGSLLRAIDGYEGKGTLTGMAMTLAAYLAQRPGEIRQMRWEELDLANAVWNIPTERAKMRKPHAVPLSRQALAIIAELQSITGEESYRGYVFPSVRTRARPMSANTMNAALRRLGYSKEETTTHGWRATAKTLLLESGKWSRDIIDRWQSRGPNDALGGAYDRTEYWPERVALSQWWSDYLDTLRNGADIVPFPDREAV